VGAPSKIGGIGGANFSVSMRRITDGTSNTVAVDELRAGLNADDLRGCWAMPGLGSGASALFRDAHIPNPPGAHADDMENCGEAGFEGDSSSGMGCYDPGATTQMAARSLHPGGVHTLMVDGSVRFVADSIQGNPTQQGSPPQGVWQAVHTRGGGEIVSVF
jgi:prepilin-type processing-associated H-X9-DG protein